MSLIRSHFFISLVVLTLEQIHRTKSVIMTTERSISQIKNPKNQRDKKGWRKTKQKVVRLLFYDVRKSKQSQALFCLAAVIPSLYPTVQHCFPPLVTQSAPSGLNPNSSWWGSALVCRPSLGMPSLPLFSLKCLVIGTLRMCLEYQRGLKKTVCNMKVIS